MAPFQGLLNVQNSGYIIDTPSGLSNIDDNAKGFKKSSKLKIII